jgi:hypothetical protein
MIKVFAQKEDDSFLLNQFSQLIILASVSNQRTGAGEIFFLGLLLRNNEKPGACGVRGRVFGSSFWFCCRPNAPSK